MPWLCQRGVFHAIGNERQCAGEIQLFLESLQDIQGLQHNFFTGPSWIVFLVITRGQIS